MSRKVTLYGRDYSLMTTQLRGALTTNQFQVVNSWASHSFWGSWFFLIFSRNEQSLKLKIASNLMHWMFVLNWYIYYIYNIYIIYIIYILTINVTGRTAAEANHARTWSHYSTFLHALFALNCYRIQYEPTQTQCKKGVGDHNVTFSMLIEGLPLHALYNIKFISVIDTVPIIRP